MQTKEDDRVTLLRKRPGWQQVEITKTSRWFTAVSVLTRMGKTTLKTNKKSLSVCEKDSENLWMNNLLALIQPQHSWLLQLL